jgi:hypothetical protein
VWQNLNQTEKPGAYDPRRNRISGALAARRAAEYNSDCHETSNETFVLVGCRLDPLEFELGGGSQTSDASRSGYRDRIIFGRIARIENPEGGLPSCGWL